jgi:hypothetical protein
MRTTLHIPGHQPAPDEALELPVVYAGPDYFHALGIPLLRGAELHADAAVDSLPRVVVSAAMARRYWPGRDPVGAVVRIGGGAPAVVVGVAADARLRALAEAPAPNFVVQRAGGGGPTALIRTRGEAAAALPLLRQALAAPTGPYVLRRLRAMDEITAASLQAARAVAAAVTGLSLAALALAVVGLYGVVSYLAAQRTREFGTRVALGARATDVLGLVLRAGLRLALVGGAAGIALGVAAGAALRGLLFDAAPVEVATLAAVAAVMGLVSVAACAVPAVRAARLSPAVTLRVE